jgi:hypothetical protein
MAALERWLVHEPWQTSQATAPLRELRITRGAYPAATQEAIRRYLTALQQESPCVQSILRFTLLCVLEEISFTRKDGQYLRWDHRSGRRQGKKIFDKGTIQPFTAAIRAKLVEIMQDHGGAIGQASLFIEPPRLAGRIRLLNGSCLSVMPTLPSQHYDVLLITRLIFYSCQVLRSNR